MILKLGKKKEAALTQTEVLAREAKNVISDCCDAKTAALVISTSTATVSNATFQSFDEKQIQLLLHDSVTLRPLALCCVSFMIHNRGHVFLAKVVDNFEFDGKKILSIELPDHVSYTELRSMFRVPVVDSAELTCTVRIDGAEQNPNAGDINLNGICFTDVTGPLPDMGDILDIKLNCNEIAVAIQGEVRHAANGRIGIFFVGKKDESLQTLVRNLEMEYLRFKKTQ